MTHHPSRHPRRPEPPGPGFGWWLWAAVCGLAGIAASLRATTERSTTR